MASLPSIDKTTFSTSLIEPSLRLHHYRRWLQAICEVSPCEDAPLRASILMFRTGGITVASSVSSPAHYSRHAGDRIDHTLDHYVLAQLVVRGEVNGTFDDHTCDMGQGDIYLCDLAARTDLWVDAVDQIHLLIPRSLLAQANGSLHGCVVPRASSHCRMLRDRFHRMVSASQAAAPEHMTTLVAETVQLLAQCINNGTRSRASSESLEATRRDVMDYIDAHLTDVALNPELLLQQFAVSRAKLYRLFADLGGIQRYIRDRRLDGAVREICRHPKRSISDTAKRYGFTNSRQFQRAIQSRFGITARDARRRWGSHSGEG